MINWRILNAAGGDAGRIYNCSGPELPFGGCENKLVSL